MDELDSMPYRDLNRVFVDEVIRSEVFGLKPKDAGYIESRNFCHEINHVVPWLLRCAWFEAEQVDQKAVKVRVYVRTDEIEKWADAIAATFARAGVIALIRAKRSKFDEGC